MFFKTFMKSLPCYLGAMVVSAASVFAQFPLVTPAFSGSGLGFTGHPDEGFGIVGYSTTGAVAPDRGHSVGGVVLNAPNFQPLFDVRAHYYITGMQNSPFATSAEKVATARATTPINLPNLAAFVAETVEVSFSDIRFNFGNNSGSPLTSSWNLGADAQGVDWTGGLGSSVEERIYRADPAEASSALYFRDTPIIVFGYSPLYETINYGATTAGHDDLISAFSDPVSAMIVDGLAGNALDLANAFLADVAAGGGKVRLLFDTVQTVTYMTNPELGYIHGNYSFSGSIMVVPEPASYASLVGGGVLAGVLTRRRRV